MVGGADKLFVVTRLYTRRQEVAGTLFPDPQSSPKYDQGGDLLLRLARSSLLGNLKIAGLEVPHGIPAAISRHHIHSNQACGHLSKLPGVHAE